MHLSASPLSLVVSPVTVEMARSCRSPGFHRNYATSSPNIAVVLLTQQLHHHTQSQPLPPETKQGYQIIPQSVFACQAHNTPDILPWKCFEIPRPEGVRVHEVP